MDKTTLLFDIFTVLCDDIRTIERHPDMLLNASKDIDLAVNTGKTKFMEIGLHKDMMANEHITIGSNSYEKVKNSKYLSSLLTNQNSVHKEIKCMLLFSPYTF